jgi:RNA polymerase sigma-70 factor (ECF subfamily)
LKQPKDQHVCHGAVYEKLFRELAPQVRNFLVYKFRDVKRSNDIVQEAFVVMWQNCKKVTPQSAKSYLFKVAQNQFIKLLDRDKTKQKYLSFKTDQAEHETPDFKMEYDEFNERLKEAIDSLPDGQREVFLLNRIDKMTYQEIAALQEVSVKAVEKKMHKALVKLRETLGEQYNW